MANTNAPFGARPIRHKSGAPYAGQQTLYYYTGSNTLYIGDPVLVTGSGNSTNYYGYPAGSLATVDIATAGNGNYLSGFITGFFAEDFSSKTYGVASANRGIYVCDDPEVIWEIQDDGVTTSTSSFNSANGNLAAGGGGSVYTNLSSWVLNTTTATTSTSQVKILRMSKRTNNALGQYAVWEIMVNLHTNTALTAGI